jgi:hypothetical protein
MAIFQPFGFQGDYSTSAASQANPTLVTFPWNPSFSGWSGDVAVQYLPGPYVDSEYTIASADGYVYPGYVSATGLTPPSDYIFNYPPIIGVIVGFKYEPINNTITPNDTWSSYVTGTAVKDNQISVIINTDLQARYKVQYKGTSLAPGITQNLLFGGAQFGADNTYDVVAGGVTFKFAVGTPSTSTGGAIGSLQGQSTIYLTQPVSQNSILQSQKLTKTTAFPLFIQTPNNYDNSGWALPGDTLSSENANTIVSVMFNQNFMGTTWVPLVTQKPLP